MKVALGLLLGFLIGAGCSAFGIPSPAPPAIVGALLVVAMTVGYVLADRYLARRAATTAHLCGGPTGETREGASASGAPGSRA
jgi:XapX domain-containing protein